MLDHIQMEYNIQDEPLSIYAPVSDRQQTFNLPKKQVPSKIILQSTIVVKSSLIKKKITTEIIRQYIFKIKFIKKTKQGKNMKN